MQFSHCDYIGCFDQPIRSETYCSKHINSLVGRFRVTPTSEEMTSMFGTLGTSEQDTDLFSKMIATLDQCKTQCSRKSHMDLFDRIEDLRQEIITEAIKNTSDSVNPLSTDPSSAASNASTATKLNQRIRQKHTETRTSRNSHVKQDIHRKVKRIIREKAGEKITEEYEEIKDYSEKMETLIQFKTERELEMYVEETTERYESKINEYAKNKELVFSALTLWFEELALEKSKSKVDVSLPIKEIINNDKIELFDKHVILYWQLLNYMWADSSDTAHRSPQSMPVLQQIIYYGIEQFPDGPRKVFHCNFSTHKLDSKFITLSVPEILLRALPCYTDIIHAFFISKFIPFKKIFMKHRRHLEILLDSKQESELGDAIDSLLEEDETGFKDDRFPEINPRVCYCKK